MFSRAMSQLSRMMCQSPDKVHHGVADDQQNDGEEKHRDQKQREHHGNAPNRQEPACFSILINHIECPHQRHHTIRRSDHRKNKTEGEHSGARTADNIQDRLIGAS
jgi:hypothetical protein